MSALRSRKLDGLAEKMENCWLWRRNSSNVFITVDKNIRYQQNLASRNITVLIIRARSGEIDDLLMHVPACTAALETIRPGQIVQIESDR